MHTQRNTLNIVPGGVPLSIHVTQYDEGSTYEFKVYSVPGQFDASDVVQVNIEGTKPDGYGIINACSFADGVVTYTIQQQLTAAAGAVRSKIVFYGESSKVLGSAVVNWIVDKAGVTNDTIISDSDISGMQEYVNQLGALVSNPVPVQTAAEMTNNNQIYVYEGSESGYTNGDWYYYNGTAWVSGGHYGSGGASVVVDPTLSITGAAADAKAAGDAVDELKSAITLLDETVVGEKNYIENKKLITATGTTRGNPIDDSNFSITELIPLSLIPSGTIVNVYYGSVPENTLFGIYDSQGTFLDAWTLQSTAENRYFTLSYTSHTDPTYFRFAFQKGYNAKITSNTGNVTYWKTNTSGGLVEDVVQVQDEIRELPATFMRTDSYVDFTMINRLNPSECETGYYMTAEGRKSENDSYFLTDYIPIKNGETLYAYRIDTGEQKAIKFVTAFDADKNVIPSLGSNTQVTSVAQSGDMAYVRLSVVYVNGDYGRMPTYTACMATLNPAYIPTYGNNPVFKSEYTRKVIRINSTDTEAAVITKMINAYKHGDCDVVFDRAVYTFGAELVKVATDYGMKWCEIPIGNNCRYYFNGATLTASIDLSQLTPAEGDDEFYCNLLGCQRKPSSYELHDGVLIATDTRYVVHDESSALSGSYKHLYQNIEMHYHTSQRQETIRKCIGGGTGESGVVEIIGCKFTTDGTDSCVSFHGNSTDVVGAEFDLNIRNSWFSNSVRGGALSTNQTARLFYTGNSAASEPNTYDRWTVTKFLNEVR